MKTFNGRQMRIFISSTFRDMFAEREQLEKHVFKRLQVLCRERNIFFSDVDLRWGVTEDQVENGNIIPICLGEIDACNYFVGILGDRYGTAVQSFSPSLLSAYPWLRGHENKSYTELEILYGVLNPPQRVEHAYFYFRSPEHPESQKYGVAKDEEYLKQIALKQAIIASGALVRDSYQSAEQFVEWITGDLTEAIERDFSLEGESRTVKEPLYYMDNYQPGFIQRPDVTQRLDEFLQVTRDNASKRIIPQPAPILCLTGSSGNGKTTLLVNWIADHPEHKIAAMFIGNHAKSTQSDYILENLTSQLMHLFELETQPDDLLLSPSAQFTNVLSRANQIDRVILVIDGLDKLMGEARTLLWLPNPLPSNVTLIVACRESQVATLLGTRPLESLVIQPLTIEEREMLAKTYLRLFGKQLDIPLLSRLINASQSANPQFLRVLLDDLRLFALGEGKPNEWLQKRLDENLKAETLMALFKRILARYEMDYGQRDKHLVQSILRALWASYQGLSEDELLDYVGRPSNLAWSPFFAALREFLINQNGLFTLAYTELAQAIQERYLPTIEDGQTAHRALANFLAQRPLDAHQTIEIPNLYLELEDWDALHHWIAIPQNFAAVWETNNAFANKIWLKLESFTPYRMVETYRSIIDTPEKFNDIRAEGRLGWLRNVADDVALLLVDAQHTSESQLLRSRQEKRMRAEHDYRRLIPTLNEQGLALMAQGKFSDAMRMFNERLEFCEQINDPGWKATTLGNIGILASMIGDDAHALMSLQGQANIEINYARIIPEHRINLGNSMHTASIILYRNGEIHEALSLNARSIEEFRQAGEVLLYARSMTFQGDMLFSLQRWDEAEVAFQAALSQLEKASDVRELDTKCIALLGLGKIIEKFHRPNVMGNYLQAIECAKSGKLYNQYVRIYAAMVRAGAKSIGTETFITGEPLIRELLPECHKKGLLEQLIILYEVLGHLDSGYYRKTAFLGANITNYQTAFGYFDEIETLYKRQQVSKNPLSVQVLITALQGKQYVLVIALMDKKLKASSAIVGADEQLVSIRKELGLVRQAARKAQHSLSKIHSAIRLGRLAEAENALETLRSYTDTLRGSSEWAACWRFWGELYESKGHKLAHTSNWEEAFDAYCQAEDAYRTAQIGHAELRMIRRIAQMHQKMTNLDYPKRHFARADELTRLMEAIVTKCKDHPWFDPTDFKMLASLIQNQASYLFQKHDWSAALPIAQKSETYQRIVLELFPDEGEEGLAFSFWVQGYGFKDAGNLEAALHCFAQAAQRFSNYQDELQEYLSTCGTEQFNLLRGIDLQNGFDPSREEEFIKLHQVAMSLFDEGNLSAALSELVEMEAKAHDLNSRAWVFDSLTGQVAIYRTLVDTYHKKGDYEFALRSAQSLTTCAGLLGNANEEITGHLFQALALRGLEQYQTGWDILESAEQESKKGLYRNLQRNIRRFKRTLLKEWIEFEKSDDEQTMLLEERLRAIPDPDNLITM